jgi:hypothetical protein
MDKPHAHRKDAINTVLVSAQQALPDVCTPDPLRCLHGSYHMDASHQPSADMASRLSLHGLHYHTFPSSRVCLVCCVQRLPSQCKLDCRAS